MEPEICRKMLKKLSEKLRAKLPATTPGCSVVKITRLHDVSLTLFLTESKPSRRSITTAKRKEKETRERRKKIFKNQKGLRLPVGHLLVQKILISAHAQARMS